MAMSQKILNIDLIKKIVHLRLQQHLPGANEFTMQKVPAIH